jgi:Zn-finger nucleic acid-binding protein
MSELTPCSHCSEKNGCDSVICWACGTPLPRAVSSLLCPLCREAMLRFQSQGMALDGCARCGGVWLDRGELASAHRLTAETLAAVDAHLGWNAGALECEPDPGSSSFSNPQSSIRGRQLLCPACAQVMKPAPDFVHHEVRVDSCPGCRGSWLDAGELGAIQQAPAQLSRSSEAADSGWLAAEGVGWLPELVGAILDAAIN